MCQSQSTCESMSCELPLRVLGFMVILKKPTVIPIVHCQLLVLCFTNKVLAHTFMVSDKHRTSSPRFIAAWCHQTLLQTFVTSINFKASFSKKLRKQVTTIPRLDKYHDPAERWPRPSSQRCDCPHPRLQTLHRMEHRQRARDHQRRARLHLSDASADVHTRDHRPLLDLYGMEPYHAMSTGRVRSNDSVRWQRGRGKSLHSPTSHYQLLRSRPPPKPSTRDCST